MGLLDGILPAIYSFGNQAQKRVRGLLNDPLGALQQQVDQQFPTEYEQENWINKKRGVPYNEYAAASGQQKIDDFARDSAMNAITVWHGSPHKFDKFDMSKIGTGEGAQAYGHGLYTAEAKKVAQEYADSLGSTQFYANGEPLSGDAAWAAMHMADNGGDVKKVLDWAKTSLKPNKEGRSAAASLVREARKLRGADIQEGTGHLYKVDIPDEAVSRMLDWDKPLSQQAPEVQAGIMKSGLVGPKHNFAADETMAGQFVKDLSPEHQQWLHKNGGIPGIRYLDGGSRGAGAGTSNYVLFDDQMPRILERNGVPTGAQPWQPGEWGGLLK